MKTKETFLARMVDIGAPNHYINIEDRGGGTGGHGALNLWFNVKLSQPGKNGLTLNHRISKMVYG